MESDAEIVEAIQEFYPLRPTELQLAVGDKLRVISRISGGWIYGDNADGRQGTFPDTHVQPVAPAAFADSTHSRVTDAPEEAAVDVQPYSSSYVRTAHEHVNIENAELMYALVLYGFNGNEYESVPYGEFRYLTVYEGDTIVVLNRSGEEWLWIRKENGSEGFIPASYVSLIEAEPEERKAFESQCEPVEEAIYEEIVDINYRLELAPSVSGEEIKATDASKLSHILIELFETEHSFMHDMQLLVDTLQLFSAAINSELVSAYLKPIIAVSTALLSFLPSRAILLNSSSDLDRHVKSVAQAFLRTELQLKSSYAEYSQNFDNIVGACGIASAPGGSEFQAAVVRHLRQQGMMCFNLETTLLKPIQRVLKYPLLLSQLKSALTSSNVGVLNCSAVTLKKVVDAVDSVQRLAEAVNESKRRQELLDRYRRRRDSNVVGGENDKPIAGGRTSILPQKFSETVSRKSNRFLFEVRTGLGLTELPPDVDIDTQVRRFHALSQCVKRVNKDFSALKQSLIQQQAPHDLLIASDLCSLQRMILLKDGADSSYNLDRRRAHDEFTDVIEKQILTPLNALQNMMLNGESGPRAFIDKCHNKRLDYARLNAEITSNDAESKKEQLNVARNVYTVLRQQLLGDLSQLNERAQCIITCAMQIHAYAKRIFMFRMLRAVEQFNANGMSAPVTGKVDESVGALLKRASELCIEKSSAAHNPVTRKKSRENLPSSSSAAVVTGSTAVTQTTVIHNRKKIYEAPPPPPLAASPMAIAETALARKKLPPPRPPPIKHANAAHNSRATEPVNETASFAAAPVPSTQQKLPAFFSKLLSKRPAPKPSALTKSAVTKKLQPKRVVYPSYVTDAHKRTDVFVFCFDFTAEHDAELSCEAGDIVVVLNRQDLTGNFEWWYVEKCVEITKLGAVLSLDVQAGDWGSAAGDVSATGGRGYVPASYLQRLPFAK